MDPEVSTIDVHASIDLLSNGSTPERDQLRREKEQLDHLARFGVDASIKFDYSYLRGGSLVPWV